MPHCAVPIDARKLRPFIVVAWLGVLTTALNTALLAVEQRGAALNQALELILLFHAIATLLPILGLALYGLRISPFAAVVVATVTFIEKSLELLGQNLQLFPPEETLAGVALRDIVPAFWDQVYFTLWLCSTLGASAAGWLMFRILSGPWRLGACSAWSAAALTLLMLLGRDYVHIHDFAVPGVLFSIVFTAYRISIAMTLQRITRQGAA